VGHGIDDDFQVAAVIRLAEERVSSGRSDVRDTGSSMSLRTSSIDTPRSWSRLRVCGPNLQAPIVT
jgi:hypothetical protein